MEAKECLSVVMPVYNEEKSIVETINRVLKQPEVGELIAVNDGSTDTSLSIIEEYSAKDSRVKVINKPNSGYGASMNRGLAIARGEYIGILESDDFAKATMFEDLYNIAEKKSIQ